MEKGADIVLSVLVSRGGARYDAAVHIHKRGARGTRPIFFFE